MSEQFDLVVIGTGVAGTTAAYKCRELGWSVAVIDKRPPGGTCPLRGCDPKKVLVGAAEIADRASRMLGKGVARLPGVQWQELVKFKRTFTQPFPEYARKSFEEAKIRLISGAAAFTGLDEINVDGESIKAGKFLIASGAKPRPLDIPGSEYLIDSERFMEIESMPEKIAFVGGGFVSFEFAHLTTRAGAGTAIIHRSDKPLARFDRDMVNMLIESSEDDGIDVRLNSPVTSVETKQDGFRVNSGDKQLTAELVVHGAGRVPDVNDLNLERANVEMGKGGIIVNDYLQSYSNPDVYAAGDAAAVGPPLTPVAIMQGSAAARNMVEGNHKKLDYSAVASCVYTEPPLAMVGLTEEEAKEKRINYRLKQQDTGGWFTSRRINNKHAGYKVLIDEDSERIVGAHLLGPSAEEIINIFALAISSGIKASDIKRVPMSYPTASSDISGML